MGRARPTRTASRTSSRNSSRASSSAKASPSPLPSSDDDDAEEKSHRRSRRGEFDVPVGVLRPVKSAVPFSSLRALAMGIFSFSFCGWGASSWIFYTVPSPTTAVCIDGKLYRECRGSLPGRIYSIQSVVCVYGEYSLSPPLVCVLVGTYSLKGGLRTTPVPLSICVDPQKVYEARRD